MFMGLFVGLGECEGQKGRHQKACPPARPTRLRNHASFLSPLPPDKARRNPPTLPNELMSAKPGLRPAVPLRNCAGMLQKGPRVLQMPVAVRQSAMKPRPGEQSKGWLHPTTRSRRRKYIPPRANAVPPSCPSGARRGPCRWWPPGRGAAERSCGFRVGEPRESFFTIWGARTPTA